MRKNAVRENSSQCYRRLLHEADEDPLAGLVNLFDVAMVFAMAILLALLSNAPLLGMISAQDKLTILKNPGKPNMEIIFKDGKQLEHYRVSENQLRGQGERLGIAYRLENGEVVYVPSSE